MERFVLRPSLSASKELFLIFLIENGTEGFLEFLWNEKSETLLQQNTFVYPTSILKVLSI